MYPVVFLSLGPGDPDLLTVKAVKILRQADVIMVPATRGSGNHVTSRAAEIMAEWCEPSRLRVYELPMLSDRQAVSVVYDQMYTDALASCRAGRRVVVAVEGDVSIYASIHYVLERLQAAGVPVSQVPGIPSFIAASALASLSLVSQQQRLAVLPGVADVATLRRYTDSGHVVVVMKLSTSGAVVKDFLRSGAAVRCHYFEQVGTAAEFYTSDHRVILERPMPYFSLCVIQPVTV